MPLFRGIVWGSAFRLVNPTTNVNNAGERDMHRSRTCTYTRHAKRIKTPIVSVHFPSFTD